MLLLNLIQNPLFFLSFLIAFLLSLTIHESAHAWVANRLGDPTAKLLGRISLNPLHHLDPLGTIFFFIVGFGWGIPVPFNPQNFRNEKLDQLKVSLAGPASNLLLAFIFSLIYRFLPLGNLLSQMTIVIIAYNIIWMIFNLLPIPPLDGSHLLAIFLPRRSYFFLQQIGTPLLIILLFFSPYIYNLINLGLTFFFKLFTGQSFVPF